MASRRTSKSSDTTCPIQDKRERDKLICYRYAQCRNATTVGREFGVSRMYVTRAWSRMTDEQRQAVFDTSEEVDEQLNQKIIEAERIAGDRFVQKVVHARDKLADELLRRVDSNDIRMISNKDFTSLLRLVANISVPDNGDTSEQSDTYRQLRESIREEIETVTDNES